MQGDRQQQDGKVKVGAETFLFTCKVPTVCWALCEPLPIKR